MPFTYDLSTTVGQVRLLIPDRVSADAFFEDDEIAGLLSIEGGNVKRGAALALETMASSEAYVQKVIRLMDLQTNGAQTAKALMDRAAALRKQAADEETFADGGAFDIAEWVNDDFSGRERLLKQALRQG
jgi:hypothetical protein